MGTEQTKPGRKPPRRKEPRSNAGIAAMGDSHYRQMFEKNHAVQLLIDPVDGAILDANRAAADFYGYSVEELKKLKITAINSLPREQVNEEMAKAAGEQRYYFVFPHTLASGEVRQVEVHSSPIELDGKQVLYSIVHDITERMQAEEEVRRLNADLERHVAERTAQLEATNRELEREIAERKALEEQVQQKTEALQSEYERLATVIASVDVSLTVLDPDGTIVLANEAWLSRTGLTREQAIGLLYRDIPDRLGGAQIQELIDEVVRTGVPFRRRELPLPAPQYPDGTLYVDGSILPIRDDEGNLTGLLTVSIDVTEKVLARREIESQRALLASIIEHSPIAIAYYDRDLRVMSGNSAWEQVSGLRRDIVIGQSLYDVSDTAEARRPLFERALAGEVVKREGVNDVRRDRDASRFYDITYVPVAGPDGSVEGILALAVEVTERELLDQQKDQFIALAAHELKSPITIIRGYSQLALKSAETAGNRSILSRIHTIDEQTQRLSRMVDDLLDVSRMQGGSLTLDQKPFDLRDAVRESIKNMKPGALDFEFETSLPSSPVTVYGDRARIEQVLTNLMQNAVKYSGKSRQVEVSMHTEDTLAVTSVRDYGLGIPAAQQSQIFDRFFRASNVRDRHSGFGLGLFIAHSIVTRHGGRIWLESVEGEGSTFHVALPLA